MNTNSKRLGIYLLIMTVLTVAATTLRSIACVIHLDFASGFFTDKSLITTADVIITVTVLGMFSYLFVAERIHLLASFSTGATYVTTGVLGVATAFLGTSVISFVTIATRYSSRPNSGMSADKYLPAIGVLCVILAFASIAHHFFNAFITESKAEIRAYFALASISFFGLYAMLIYLDPTLAIGESTKLLRLTAFLLSALFFLYEARISLGREMWRIYVAFGLAAASLTAYTSIPAIIAYFVNGELVSYASRRSLVSLEEYMLLLALCIFITARLFITVRLQEDTENKFIRTFKAYASEREREIAESSARYNKIFASKQLSIFDLYGGEIFAEEEEAESCETAAVCEEESCEPTISDDAIYESIFGEMPKKEEEEETVEVEEEALPEEPVDDRDPEEIADEVLLSLEEAMENAKKREDETEI